MTLPRWTSSVIWYAIYPLGFTGAPAVQDMVGTHRLPRITAWLDHLIELGCNGLLLGPIFDSSSHGYDTVDYFRIDPRLGDEPDFDALVTACRERGIRVMLDGVFNHLGEHHPAFQRALSDPGAAENSWFFINRDHQPPSWLNFEGSNNLVRLNHASPQVGELVTGVMRHWLARGIDAWRLDAAYAVDPDFWRRILPGIRADYPDALFMGEVIHADLDALADYPLESITGYELWKAIWSAISDGNFFELEWTLRRHQQFCEHVRPLTFVSNHDVTRIATRVGHQQAIVAAAILLTSPGMPAIYYGDEGGATGTKYDRRGGDAEIRPAMPASPGEWQPEAAWMIDHYRALIGLRRRNPWLVGATVAADSVVIDNTHLSYRLVAGDKQIQISLEIGGCVRVQITGEGEDYRFQATAR